MQAKNLELNYFVPITENASFNGEFLIKGVAINATTTANNHKFLEEELMSSATSLNGVPLLVDHNNTIESIKGRVHNGFYNEVAKRIEFEAKVMDEKIKQMIKNGLINSVSVGASVDNIEEDTDGSLVPRGIKFRELSLVAVPADNGATFGMALKEAYKIQEEEKMKYECPECGKTKMSAGAPDCPECDTKMKKMAMDNKLQVNTHNLKGGMKEAMSEEKENIETKEQIGAKISEKDLKLAEMESKLIEAEKKNAEFKAKERKALEESYAKIATEKKVKAMDVSAKSDELIQSLIEQLNSVVIKEDDEEVKPEVSDTDEVEEKGYKVVQGFGSLRGGSYTIERY